MFFNIQRRDELIPQIWQSPNQNQEQGQKEMVAQDQSFEDQILDLYKARDRLMSFVKKLGVSRRTQLRKDVILHCSQLKLSKKSLPTFLSDDSIVRFANQRISKMLKNKKIKKNWSEEDIKILVWVISKFADQQEFSDIEKDISEPQWEQIARLIPGVTGQSCMFKWLSLKKINLTEKGWKLQQSHCLRNIIEHSFEGVTVENINWKVVSQMLYDSSQQSFKTFRSPKQCRQHWNCFLNPQIKKGPWSVEEDLQLLRTIKNNNGDKKWSMIVGYLNGRTQNALKNRFNLLLERQRKKIKEVLGEMEIVNQILRKFDFEDESKKEKEDFNQQLFTPAVSEGSEIIKPRTWRNNQFLLENTCIFEHESDQDKSISMIRVEKLDAQSLEKLFGREMNFNTLQPGVFSNGKFERKFSVKSCSSIQSQ